MAKSGPSLDNFTNTFVLTTASSTRRADKVLSEVPKALAGDPARQRRAHRKSRTGCENCRRRRVKCNEGSAGSPCASCSRRGERCQLPARRAPAAPSIPKGPGAAAAAAPGYGPGDTAVNLHHLKLLHHFHTCTRHTLMLTPEVWDHALQLSFGYEFLMNTVLCVAARHLAFLHPDDAAYPRAAASHVCRALPGFRDQLSGDFARTDVDAFIATSLLLQYEAWTSTIDFCSADGDTPCEFDPTTDRVFAMGSSLKEVFLKSLPLLSGQPSKFLPLLQYNPMDSLVAAARVSKGTLAKYQQFFSPARPVRLELLEAPLPCHGSTEPAVPDLWLYRGAHSQEEYDPIEDGFTFIIARVCLALSFLPEAQPLDDVDVKSPLFSDLVRYIFSFGIICHGPFAMNGLGDHPGSFSSMVRRGDPHAISILYHFYRAARILLPPEECWWAHKRAAASEVNLREWLTRESAKQFNEDESGALTA
ncbi:hypothetical protein GGR52DRAFT_415070 [Hypoxylon sp. FL1284]|nr:hypothetical protein GGR52DRAFT_415070 [Hypoxylon sp. FL1284]